MIKNVKINTQASLKTLWKLVNAVTNCDTPEEIRARCTVAENWVVTNKLIDNDQYNNLMMAISYQFRESYHL